MNNAKSVSLRKQKIKIFFLIGIVLISLFFSNKEINYLYYIGVSPILMYILIFLLSINLLLFNKRIYLDLISAILIARLILYIIPIFYTDYLEGYWGNYFSVISSFIAYFVASQYSYNDNKDMIKKINRILAFYLIMVSLQVIYLFFKLSAQYGYLNINLLKYYMVTPVGASNYIASIILPLIFLIYYSEFKKWLKTIIILTSLLALFIIGSKNSILVLIILISIKLIKTYIKKIKEIKYSSSAKVPIMIVTVILFIGIIIVAYIIIRYFIVKWNMGMTYRSDSIYEVINALSSDRLDVYLKEINRWSEHFLIGNGLAYELGYYRSHNWIIDLLVQSGVIGLSIFCGAIICWYKKVYIYIENSKFIKSAYYSIIVILLQGLAEVTLFTIAIDILLWYLIGLSIAEANYLKRNYKYLDVENED